MASQTAVAVGRSVVVGPTPKERLEFPCISDVFYEREGSKEGRREGRKGATVGQLQQPNGGGRHFDDHPPSLPDAADPSLSPSLSIWRRPVWRTPER